MAADRESESSPAADSAAELKAVGSWSYKVLTYERGTTAPSKRLDSSHLSASAAYVSFMFSSKVHCSHWPASAANALFFLLKAE